MLYVGMTRARKDLYIYSVRERYDKKIAPSRFLREVEAGLTDTARQQT